MADDVIEGQDPTAGSSGFMPVGCCIQDLLKSSICWNTNWVVNKPDFWLMSSVLLLVIFISSAIRIITTQIAQGFRKNMCLTVITWIGWKCFMFKQSSCTVPL